MEEMSSSEINLPGFRFHPTEEELLDFYLKNRVFGKKLGFDIIRLLNIYHHDPWDLPGLSKVGEREWYFFVPRDRKHGSGGRPNRTTEKGFWKATGSERKIFSQSGSKRVLGFKKTLVFYKGRAPRGIKTDWIMNEYRLPDAHPLPKDIVLCKIYRKATSLKVLEQRAMLEEELKRSHSCQTFPSTSSSAESGSFCCQHEDVSLPQQLVELNRDAGKVTTLEDDDGEGVEVTNKKTEGPSSSTSLQMPLGYDPLPELQLPKMNPIDWTQDQLWTQFNSPWLQNWAHYANILNF